ncbi:DUF1304 domain-containing protein [Simiduia agarivorans]|nr:DUF1304 domain-containing protein [Simiduia agarivorans]
MLIIKEESMNLLAVILVLIVALLHIGFLLLEMVWWDKPLGRKVFRMSEEQAAATKVLAMNQGLYNGFLAAGLLVGSLLGNDVLVTFSLVCVIVAGVFGAMTVSSRILWIQAAPAVAALVACWIALRLIHPTI